MLLRDTQSAANENASHLASSTEGTDFPREIRSTGFEF